jgi:hypothetical protein
MKQLKARIKTWIIQLESGEIKSKQLKILSYIKNNLKKINYEIHNTSR